MAADMKLPVMCVDWQLLDHIWLSHLFLMAFNNTALKDIIGGDDVTVFGRSMVSSRYIKISETTLKL